MRGTICILLIICDFTILLKIVFQIGASGKCFDRVNKKPTNYLYTIPLFDFEKATNLHKSEFGLVLPLVTLWMVN